jgi:hypothetical protein
MRVWGERYNRDLQRYNLALRMIAHEARTHNVDIEWHTTVGVIRGDGRDRWSCIGYGDRATQDGSDNEGGLGVQAA